MPPTIEAVGLIKRYGDGSVELYDLAEDIGEQNNLAKTSPELAAKLEAKLERWLHQTGASMPTWAK